MLAVLACGLGLQAQTVTYTNLVISGTGTNVVTIRPNQVAKVLTAHMSLSAIISIKIEGKTFIYEGDQLWPGVTRSSLSTERLDLRQSPVRPKSNSSLLPTQSLSQRTLAARWKSFSSMMAAAIALGS